MNDVKDFYKLEFNVNTMQNNFETILNWPTEDREMICDFFNKALEDWKNGTWIWKPDIDNYEAKL